MPKTAYKFKGRKCCLCGSLETYIKNTGEPWWIRYKKNGIWDRISHICMKCHIKVRSPDCKNRQFKITGDHGKGLIGEAVVMKIRKIGNYNVYVNNFCAGFDLFNDLEYGRIQVKTKVPFYGNWSSYFGIEHDFDTLIFLCMSEDRKSIERVYIIPERDLSCITGVNIVPNEDSKWGKFRLKDVCIYNNMYHSLLSFFGDRRFFDFRDIEKWLIE